MNVTGPNWPSTQALRAALAEVAPATYTLAWGQRGFDGWEQLVRFAEHGVPCPAACNTLVEARNYITTPPGRVLWGRKLNHTQGTDIVAPAHPRWKERDFWVEPLDTADEYRQHVWDGKCIRVGKKVQTEPPTRVLPIRSRRNGWTIDYAAKVEDPTLRATIRDVAKRAVTALGYTGGAVDLVVTKDGGVYVLEVNTAPALRDANTLAAYVRAISEWAKRLR